MKLHHSFIIIIGLFSFTTAVIQEQNVGSEIAIGYTPTIYSSGFSMQLIYTLDIGYQREIKRSLCWRAGTRLRLEIKIPEIYAQLLTEQTIGLWSPRIGVEAGISGFASFSDGALLLRETREAMQKAVLPVYLAVWAAPLSFSVGNSWRFSILELSIGTHLDHLGRTLRMQLGIISIGKNL